MAASLDAIIIHIQLRTGNEAQRGRTPFLPVDIGGIEQLTPPCACGHADVSYYGHVTLELSGAQHPARLAIIVVQVPDHDHGAVGQYLDHDAMAVLLG